jgi:hypothetical protein
MEDNKVLQVSKKLDERVGLVLKANLLPGFEHAHQMASAIHDLKKYLDDEYMSVIMPLCGSAIGFLTDKDKEPEQNRYSVAVVRDCLIEATLKGVEPVNNQFNIIASRCYITKNGFKYLLKKMPGLTHNVFAKGVNIANDSKSAVVTMQIDYSIDGKPESIVVPFAVKMNAYMGADGAIGKGERKALKFLYEKLTGVAFDDGDADPDGMTKQDQREVGSMTIEKATEEAKTKSKPNIVARVENFLKGIATVEELRAAKHQIPEDLIHLYESRETELLAADVQNEVNNGTA